MYILWIDTRIFAFSHLISVERYAEYVKLPNRYRGDSFNQAEGFDVLKIDGKFRC